ncbi:SecDF P1 head subdomain-containing protein [Chenggangzhangella methanolivorans]|uniref:SecDF P1 head subdomain domain-containing protein n=1 Tax=Chenggangzhangella methanolivorans TaxID=1437009 RepID=A0A9E6RCK0_9HYPH|nr:hypothetical protein [Chenggangzhangella methanolivorans]QZO00748.1 hypothetical protein K6K41_03430 [Chenggangzhangella methanolivorans]
MLVRSLAGILLAAAVAVAAHAATGSVRLKADDATVTFDADGRAQVVIKLNRLSSLNLATFTRDRVGLTVDILIDGAVVMSPVIRSPIEGGQIAIAPASEDSALAQRLADRLKAGETILVRTRDQ